MSTASSGRKRPREFKLGGQRAQQVQRARVNALAAQFDKLAPDLRTPALTALQSRCKASEKATWVQLYYQDRIAAAAKHGAKAIDTERKLLVMDCINTLWGGTNPSDVATALSGLLQEATVGEAPAAEAPPSDAPKLPLPAPTGRSASSTSDAAVLGVTIETQTPTGLPQLLLAEALSWHGQSPSASQHPEVNSIGVGTGASYTTTSESHTQTAFDVSASSMPPATVSLSSPTSAEVGTSTTSAIVNEPLSASSWAWGGLDATTQTIQARAVATQNGVTEQGGSGESIGLQVMVGDSDELTAPSPQQASLSARGGRTADSGTSPLRFEDDLWE